MRRLEARQAEAAQEAAEREEQLRETRRSLVRLRQEAASKEKHRRDLDVLLERKTAESKEKDEKIEHADHQRASAERAGALAEQREEYLFHEVEAKKQEVAAQVSRARDLEHRLSELSWKSQGRDEHLQSVERELREVEADAGTKEEQVLRLEARLGKLLNELEAVSENVTEAARRVSKVERGEYLVEDALEEKMLRKEGEKEELFRKTQPGAPAPPPAVVLGFSPNRSPVVASLEGKAKVVFPEADSGAGFGWKERDELAWWSRWAPSFSTEEAPGKLGGGVPAGTRQKGGAQPGLWQLSIHPLSGSRARLRYLNQISCSASPSLKETAEEADGAAGHGTAALGHSAFSESAPGGGRLQGRGNSRYDRRLVWQLVEVSMPLTLVQVSESPAPLILVGGRMRRGSARTLASRAVSAPAVMEDSLMPWVELCEVEQARHGDRSLRPQVVWPKVERCFSAPPDSSSSRSSADLRSGSFGLEGVAEASPDTVEEPQQDSPAKESSSHPGIGACRSSFSSENQSVSEPGALPSALGTDKKRAKKQVAILDASGEASRPGEGSALIGTPAEEPEPGLFFHLRRVTRFQVPGRRPRPLRTPDLGNLEAEGESKAGQQRSPRLTSNKGMTKAERLRCSPRVRSSSRDPVGKHNSNTSSNPQDAVPAESP